MANPLPDAAAITAALQAAGLDVAGVAIVTDVAGPSTFLRVGRQIVRVDWPQGKTPRAAEVRSALFDLSRGELTEVIE